MRLHVPSIACSVACALTVASSCGRETFPSAHRELDLRSWWDLASLLEVESAPPAFDPDAARVERALWLEARAQVLVTAEGTGGGTGEVRVLARQDGEADVELGSFRVPAGASQTQVYELPGEGGRAVELVLEGESGVRWRELTLREARRERRVVQEAEPDVVSLAGRNVILIVADSLHAKHLSAYGYDRPTSPGLEKLAAGGVLFENAYSQTSWTLSSISSLFTSHQQERHGVLNIDQRLDGRFETLAELFERDGYRTVGLIQNGILWHETGLGQGFDEYKTFNFDAAGLAEMVGRAEEVVAEPADEPLFLYIHFTPPHQPYQPPPEFVEAFVDPDYDGEVDGSIVSCATINMEKPPIDSPDAVHLRNLYEAHICFVDDQIQKLLRTAGARADLEDTLVIFTSDHGEAFLQHGAQGHNAHVYEEMIHIPLIFSAPGSELAQGKTVDTPTTLIDVLPTLVDLLGLESPTADLDGVSVAPLLAPETRGVGERTLFFSSRYKKKPEDLPKVQFAMRAGGYKVVVKKGKAALYDLASDPGEQRDISAEYPVRTRALHCALGDWWRTARADAIQAASTTHTAEVLEQLEALGYAESSED